MSKIIWQKAASPYCHSHSSAACAGQARSPAVTGERRAMRSCVATLQLSDTCPLKIAPSRGPHLIHGSLDKSAPKWHLSWIRSQGRGQNILFGEGRGYSPESWRKQVQAYNRGLGLCSHWGQGKTPGQGVSGGEVRLKLKAILKLSEQYCVLDLTFWCFQIFSSLLLTCYINMPLMQNTYIGR